MEATFMLSRKTKNNKVNQGKLWTCGILRHTTQTVQVCIDTTQVNTTDIRKLFIS